MVSEVYICMFNTWWMMEHLDKWMVKGESLELMSVTSKTETS